MVKRGIALLLTITLAAPACATTAGPSLQRAGTTTYSARARALLTDYVQKLPIGSRVRVYLIDGRRERGTLMDANGERLVIQPRTRIPEPPHEIPLDRVLAVDVESGNGGSVARAVGIGIATGAGAFLGLMMLLYALYAD